MAETDFTSDVTAENGNNVEEEETTQEEPNPERKSKHISLQLHQIQTNSITKLLRYHQYQFIFCFIIAKDDRKLFVGGLSWETGEQQLKEYFGKFGEVEAVSLKLNAETGKSRCFAFIIYKESASITKVFEQTEHAINSKKVDVKKAKAKPGKIFIGGLKPDMTEEMIRSAFEAYGTVTEIELPVDKKDNNKRKVRNHIVRLSLV